MWPRGSTHDTESVAVTPEFALINRHFDRPAKRALLGVGDDCALFMPAAGQALALSTDTLVSGVHFFANVEAATLGHKALAVNLSDLAAMGAAPRCFTLALTLPQIDDAWLASFASGMFDLAAQHEIDLVGGDTTRGPLSINITVLGEVDPAAALRRDAARPGDDIWVSGDLGGASLALQLVRQRRIFGGITDTVMPTLIEKLERPQPRLALGQALLGIAHAAIDLSDGLVADLGHIAQRSGLRATIRWNDIPKHAALEAETLEMQQQCVLTGGDDYELCFSVPASCRQVVVDLAARLALPLSCIGSLAVGAPAVDVIDGAGRVIDVPRSGFDHFSENAQ